MHDSRLLQLHFAQLSRAWFKSKHNIYADPSKKNYHDSLERLYGKMESEDFHSLKETEIKERMEVLNFFCNSLTFLDNSTSNSLPFELITCLEEALDDWSDANEYIIVTSMVKGLHEFSFNPNLAFNLDQYTIVEKLYDITFEKKLIQINIPEYLVQDYLANVVQYHELGHFIDEKYRIQEVLYHEFLSDFQDQKLDADFYIFFPFMKAYRKDFSNKEAERLLKNHIDEYFCDLFASQYVSDSLSKYLSYLSDLNGLSETHPSTELRIKFVRKFLTNSKSYTVTKFLNTTKSLTSRQIRVRFKKFKTRNFENFLPHEIGVKAELHYLYIHGWDLWYSNWKSFKRANNMKYDLDGNDVYGVINNLIEKSIGNYILKNKWKEIKRVSS